jgi:hypothetical protein
MTDDRFWELIDQARGNSAASADPGKLKAILDPLTDAEVMEFGHAFYERVCDLNQWRLWGAGYVITGGMSDDSFHYFRSWIVGKGREVFALAMDNPDELGPYVDDPEVDNELLEYVPVLLLESRRIEEDPRDLCERNADGDPLGETFDEETLGNTFPKLSALFA